MWSLSHPDDLAIHSISSGWLIADALCHPDDLAGVGISSGWVTANSLCHPDDMLFHLMSSGWLKWGWYLIRMNYGNVIMSPGWHTLPFLSHPDEIANFDFSQHTVALQRFRRGEMVVVTPCWVNPRGSNGPLTSHLKKFTPMFHWKYKHIIPVKLIKWVVEWLQYTRYK